MIYFIVLFLILIYSQYPHFKHNSRQSNRIFLILSFSTMALVLGLRGETVGEDTRHYLDVFLYAADVKWSDMLHSQGMRTGYFTNSFGYTDTIENGFLALAKLVHLFTDNGHVFLFIISAITCALFAKFIYDNSRKVVFPTIIFLCESMFMLAFNGARQIMAVSIAIQAYTLLKNQKWKKAIVVILLASVIHNVALISFALFPIMMIKPRKEFKAFKYAIIAAIASPFVVMMGQTLISKFFPRYATYFYINYWENSLGGIVILLLAEFLFILLMYRKKFRIDRSFDLSCLVIIYIACELMGLRVSMFARVGWFFRPFLILFLPKAEQYLRFRNRRFVHIAICALLLLLYSSYARTPARAYCFFWR